ncbi:gamma-aminobutyric acid type B receptor subunit 2-like [Neolamprologus brichardi]|uniref:gamma-aminobutyric acid type B receptor subunit 2-like n=1 Tax=Neolamprologus brichardi TaxID=32507 RepID=UPI001643992C|nr:gamma-aminobutyric acid type B receptor subunit 2-like [Neolamprologus brichardi]
MERRPCCVCRAAATFHNDAALLNVADAASLHAAHLYLTATLPNGSQLLTAQEDYSEFSCSRLRSERAMGRFGRVQEGLGLLLVFWLMMGLEPAQGQHPLPVLWLMPVSSRSGGENVTADVAPAVRLALQDLKKQPPPLGNYEIQLQRLDSQCDPAEALKALFDAVWVGPKYLLLFGGVCPPVTALIARALPALGLVQVSFAPSAPGLSNRKLYRNVFSTVPSDRALNQAAVKLLQRYKWTRVGVVTQEGPRLSEMKKDLIRQLLRAGVHVAVTESLSGDVCGRLKKLKDEDVRIIIAQLEDESVSEVFCCAYRLNLFGARYQWIVAGGGAAGWRLGWKFSGCTANSLLVAADGAIRLQVRELGNANTPGVSGRTPQDYQDSYLRQLIQEGSEVSSLHSFAYDAVWVVAKALSQATEVAKQREKYSPRRNVTVSGEEVARMLLEAVRSTRFEGVTGPVFFRNGERMTSIELLQFQVSSGVLVGEFNTSTQQLRLMHHLLRFKGPGPAKDQPAVLLQHRHISLLLYIVISSAAGATIIIALIVLFFVIVSRKHRRLGSGGASQDELLLLGVLLSSSSVLFSGLDEASLSDWMFGLLCSQSRAPSAGCVMFWLFLVDALVLTSWQILDPLRWEVLQHNTEGGAAEDVIIRPYSERCSSANMELWLTVVYGYKAPLLLLGCFVALNIWTAEVSEPAGSGKQLALSTFALTAFSVSGVSGSLLTSHNPPVQFCVSSILILCCDLFILSGWFGPKIVFVCWSGGGGLQQASGLQGDAAQEEEDQLSRLNQQLRSESAQLDVEIEIIRMELSETSGMFQRLMRDKHAEIGSVTHEAQICAKNRNSESEASTLKDINSPEHMRRRLSVQLPILHHSYLPAIGGISSSSSSLFGSQEVFVDQHNNSLYT